jgi:hypothetical protein
MRRIKEETVEKRETPFDLCEVEKAADNLEKIILVAEAENIIRGARNMITFPARILQVTQEEGLGIRIDLSALAHVYDNRRLIELVGATVNVGLTVIEMPPEKRDEPLMTYLVSNGIPIPKEERIPQPLSPLDIKPLKKRTKGT